LETAKEIINHLPTIVRIIKALGMAVKHKLTTCDALFIALLVNTGAPLLTSDGKQAETSEDYGLVTTLI
jgi:predicted nucleic acid-binding protein